MAPPDARTSRSAGRLGKVLALDPSDVGRLAEAVLAVLTARVALRLFRVETLVLVSRQVALAAQSTGSAPGGAAPDETRNQDGRVAWAVGAASGVLGLTCLPRSLALCWLLARKGRAADVCLGAPRNGQPFPWHAWVELDGRPVEAGGAEAEHSCESAFELVCRLPRESAVAVDAEPGQRL